MSKIRKEDIDKIDCKHIVYCESNIGCDDLLVVKEKILLKSGEVVPNLRFIKNYKRDFYVTKDRYRKPDSQKKEWEELNKVKRFSTTQSNLLRSIGKALGRPGGKGNLRMLARSPFLYAADISTSALLNHQYKEKYGGWRVPSTVAVLDLETDVVKGHERPIYGSLTFKDRVYLGVTEEFIGTISNPVEKLQAMAKKLIGKQIEERNIKLEIEVVQDAGRLCKTLLDRAHEWKPDFVAIWNLDFDIPKITKVLLYYGYDLATVFSDPSVPEEFKSFKYRRGQTQKVTVSGAITPIHYADRWHSVICPASFYFIDAMCVYKKIRVGAPNETSYSLDAILKKNIDMGKLEVPGTEHVTGLDWHVLMQKDYKLEYGIYNIFDCIGVEILDEKTKDLATAFPVQAGISDFKDYNSQPKRLVDKLHFFCLEYDLVIASVSNDMVEELDKFVVGMRDLIVTLPSFLVEDNGLFNIEELPNRRSMMRIHVNDLDVKGAYPETESALNISKETTYRELSKIEGVDEVTKRFCCINITASHVNAVEICKRIFKAPDLNTLLVEFEKETVANIKG